MMSSKPCPKCGYIHAPREIEEAISKIFWSRSKEQP